MTKFRILLWSLVLLQVLLSAHMVLADTGPKPTMEFTFNMNVINPIAVMPRRWRNLVRSDCIAKLRAAVHWLMDLHLIISLKSNSQMACRVRVTFLKQLASIRITQ